jgi:GTPase
MTWRIAEGKGMCYYYIGITDDGIPRGISRKYMEKSIKNLGKITNYLGFNYEIVYLKKGISGGFCAKVFIVNNNSTASYN